MEDEILHAADETVNDSASLSKNESGGNVSENDTDDEQNVVCEVLLTTDDNPFDPFDDFDNWFKWDEDLGYHTCAYVSRIARLSDEMSDEEELGEIERACDEILANDFAGIYKKVRRKYDGGE